MGKVIAVTLLAAASFAAAAATPAELQQRFEGEARAVGVDGVKCAVSAALELQHVTIWISCLDQPAPTRIVRTAIRKGVNRAVGKPQRPASPVPGQL